MPVIAGVSGDGTEGLAVAVQDLRVEGMLREGRREGGRGGGREGGSQLNNVTVQYASPQLYFLPALAHSSG